MASLFGGSVVVVGSCNMDMVTRATRFPSAGEHLIASDFGTYLGGKGANQALQRRVPAPLSRWSGGLAPMHSGRR